MIHTAQTFTGLDPSATASTGVVLKRGESALLSLPRVSLVEVKRAQGHYYGANSGFSFRVTKGVRYHVGGTRGTFVEGPEGHKVTDVGSAVITSQRVIFHGSMNSREWAFSKLMGLDNDATRPLTLLHVSNRQKVSGLLYPHDTAQPFRYYLGLGIARQQDASEGFIGNLRAERAASVKPTSPPIALASEAPAGLTAALSFLGRIYLGKPGSRLSLRIAQAIAATFITLAALGTVVGPTTPKSEGAILATSTTSNLATAPAASPSPADASPPSPALPQAAVAPTIHPPKTTSSPATHVVAVQVTPAKVAPAPAAPPAPVTTKKQLCGAPANPYGYNYCGSGALIYSPAPDVCRYFSCIANFTNGTGYMEQCADTTVSMSGGRRGACSRHGGELHAVNA